MKENNDVELICKINDKVRDILTSWESGGGDTPGYWIDSSVIKQEDFADISLALVNYTLSLLRDARLENDHKRELVKQKLRTIVVNLNKASIKVEDFIEGLYHSYGTCSWPPNTDEIVVADLGGIMEKLSELIEGGM